MAIDSCDSIFCVNSADELHQIVRVHAFIFDPLKPRKTIKQLSFHFCHKLTHPGFIMRLLLDRENQG